MDQARSIVRERAADALCHGMRAAECIRFERTEEEDDYGNVSPQERLLNKLQRKLDAQTRRFIKLNPNLSDMARQLMDQNTTHGEGALVAPFRNALLSNTPIEGVRALVNACDELGWGPVLRDYVEALSNIEFVREYSGGSRPRMEDMASELKWLRNIENALQVGIAAMAETFRGDSVIYVSNWNLYDNGELDAADDDDASDDASDASDASNDA
jgi:hypothetical protein